MKKFLTIVFFVVLIYCICIWLIMNKNSIFRTKSEYESFTNIPGDGVIDDKNHIYWDSRNKVFFKDNHFNICYIAERTDVEETFYIKEVYTRRFTIDEKTCKVINYVLARGNYLYALTNKSINVYNLKTKKVKVHKMNKKYEVYGIKDKEIYFKYKNKYYKVDKNINKKVKIDEIPKDFDYIPQKFDFSKNEP